MSLSKRGQSLLGGPGNTRNAMPEYLRTHFQRASDPWHPESCPDGYLGLCVAENTRVWDLIGPRVQQARKVPESAFRYNSMRGSEEFRTQLAKFLGERLAHRPIDPDHVSVLGGAGSVLELLFYSIADPGDAVLIPTPSYAGFWLDLETRNALHIVPVHGRSHTDFEIGPTELEDAYRNSDRPVRALLLTNPDNPRGTMHQPGAVEKILGWAESRSLHVVMDEVYAFSVFDSDRFVSSLARTPQLGPRQHVVWAFSKDFAASGLRCGVLISENEDINRAVDALAYWACVSGDTQHLLGELISDTAWVSGYLNEMPKRLRQSYRLLAKLLDAAGLPHVRPGAGFFVLTDFRKHLTEPSFTAEHALWRRLLVEANVNFTPGQACRIHEPGFMRICHTAASQEGVAQALRRVSRLLV